jgi:PKD repeat protein
LDGDGDNDVLSASMIDNKIAWYANDGSGNFGEQQIITTAADYATDVYAIDLDGDGDNDVLSASYSDDKLAYYINDGNGNFGEQQIITTAADAVKSVYAIDLDGDGDNDVLSASYLDDKIAWYENLGFLPTDPLPPIADFTTTPAPSTDTLYICSGQTVYTNNTSQYATNYIWDFGDGYTSNATNPTHSYNQAGTYTLSLVATDNSPIPMICEADAGLLSVIGIEGGWYFTGYNNSPDYTQTYMAMDIDGNVLAESSDYIDLLTEAGVYLVAINYRTAEVMPSNTLAGLQEQVANGECIDIDTHDVCGLLGYFSTQPVYSDVYGGYLIEYIIDGYLPYFPNLNNYDPYVAPYHVVQVIVGGLWGDYILINSDYQPFAFGDTVLFCRGACCRTIIIPDAPPGGIVADNSTQKPASNNMATDTMTMVVVVQAAQAPDITCISTLCANDTAYYQTNAVCSSYNWSVEGGTILDGQGTDHITVLWANLPNASITLNAECGDNYCDLPTVAAIPVLTNTATITGDNQVCPNETTYYALPYWGGTNYVWTIDPPQAATIVSGNNSNQVGIAWTNMPATLQVAYYNPIIGCQGTASMSVALSSAFELDTLANICVGNTSIIGTNVSSVYNYNWTVTGGNIIDGQNSANITVEWTTAGIGTVSATPINPNSFCNTIATTNVNILPLAQSPSIMGDTLVCPNQLYSYAASPLQNNTTFNWSAAGGTIVSGQNTANVSIVWGNAPTYQLSVVRETTANNVCNAQPSTLNIHNLSADGMVSISGNNMICPANNYTYHATPALGNMDYVWSINPSEAGQIVMGQNTPDITIQWATNSLSGVVLHLSICEQEVSYPINFSAIPQVTIAQSNVLCSNNTSTLTASGVGLSYQWLNEDGNIIGTNANLSINTGGTYSVVASNDAGCVSNAAMSVNEYTAPVADILSNGSLVCTQSPNNVQLMAIDGTNYTFEWSSNGSPIAGANTPFYTHIGSSEVATFNYQTMVTDTSNGCQSLSDIALINQLLCTGIIDTIPDTLGTDTTEHCMPSAAHQLNFGVNNIADGNCNTIIFSQLSVGDFLAFTIYWGDGTNQVLTGTTATHTYPNELEIYHIRLVGFYENPDNPSMICYSVTTKQYEVPIAARFDVLPACLGSAWEFQDRSYYLPTANIVSWIWDFGDGSPLEAGGPTSSHVYNSPGFYNVTLTVSEGDCTMSQSKTIEVLPLPTFEFTADGILCLNNVVSFVPSSSLPLIDYTWDFGDGNTFEGANPTHQYSSAGTYTITAQATTELGCPSTASPISITINELPIPQAITASDTLLCLGETALLTAPNGTAYLWTNGTTNNTLSVAQSGNYAVRVSDSNGCYYHTAPINIQVNMPPDATIYPIADTVHFCYNADRTLYVNPSDNYTYNWSNGSNNSAVQASAANNSYSVTVTDTYTGCSASDNAIANVANQSIVTPNIVVVPPAICEGEVATLFISNTISNIDHFVWTNGEQDNSVQVATSGVYSVYAVDEWGCTSNAADEVAVNVNSLPNTTLFPAGCYELCEGESLILPPNIGVSYQWFFNESPISNADNAFNPSETGEYYVIMTNEAGCTDTSGILYLQIVTGCPQTVLPVQLIQFSGEATAKGNQLYWTSANETNCAYYTLQYSSNGSQFSPIAHIDAQGNSYTTQQYDYLHQNSSAISYYSLSQTDYDGTNKQLGTIVLQRGKDPNNAILLVYPNPTQNWLNVHYETNNAELINLQLYDVTGRILQQQQLQANVGSNDYSITLTQLPNGIYYLRINEKVMRIVKE